MVIDIDGDASFSMTAMELATASQFDIGVKVMVLNNEFQGMVEQWQGLYYFLGVSCAQTCMLNRCWQTYFMITGTLTRE
jgi:thiamine pyrophosphate-dependent acetolactate synthase large subunit-like protein